MNRTKFLILATILFLVTAAALVGGYLYLTHTKVAEEPADTEIVGSLAETSEPVDSTTINGSSSPAVAGRPPKLRHLTVAPVAGYDFVDTANGYVIWYVDRANGNIFQTSTTTEAVTRITNSTIPKVYEAYIGKGGSNVILRTLNEAGTSVQTFIGTPRPKKATASSTPDNTLELTGIFTSDIISQLSLSPAKDRFFGMTGTQSGIGNTYTFAAKSANVFTHPLKKWVPQWVNSSSIIMTSAPAARTQNISYILNPVTKSFTKLLGPKNGLVVSASPSAAKLIYSENKGDALGFGVYDIKTGVETPISNGTIPDKCVWSKKDASLAYCGFPKNIGAGLYPDDWYQGKIVFNDILRTIDVDTLRFDTVSDLEAVAGTEIDASNLMLSSDEKYILFTNKNDLTLWMLEL